MTNCFRFALIPALLVGLAGTAQAQSTARERRQLALTEASQTVQRIFTCVADGVNGDSNVLRIGRAAQCLQENFTQNSQLIFNGFPLNGVAQIINTFTGTGPGAVQFDAATFDVHTIVDKRFTPATTSARARIELRVNVVTTFRNLTNNQPPLPLALGEYAVTFLEDFVLEEVSAGRWQAVQINAVPLAIQRLPNGTVVLPYPLVPSVPRS